MIYYIRNNNKLLKNLISLKRWHNMTLLNELNNNNIRLLSYSTQYINKRFFTNNKKNDLEDKLKKRKERRLRELKKNQERLDGKKIIPEEKSQFNFKIWGAIGGIIGGFLLLYHGITNEKSPFRPLAKPFINLFDLIEEKWGAPTREKLLPDWPYGNIPLNAPCPPTLVISLEDCLVTQDFDPVKGHRWAKRPGVDKFLFELAHYYEIIVWSSQHFSSVAPIIESLDKQHAIAHTLCRDSSRSIKHIPVKDLTYMNRDKKKIIVLEPKPEEMQLQPENAIFMTPFNDVHNPNGELMNIIPFLKALVLEGVDNFPLLFQELGTQKGPELIHEYNKRIVDHYQEEEQKKLAGLGGALRGVQVMAPVAPKIDIKNASIDKIKKDMNQLNSDIALDEIEDNTPPPPLEGEKLGGFWKSFRDYKERKEEEQRVRGEAMQQMMMRKEKEFLEKQEKEKQKRNKK